MDDSAPLPFRRRGFPPADTIAATSTFGILASFTMGPPQSPYLYSVLNPPAIDNDGVSTFTLEVATAPNSSVVGVQVFSATGWVDMYDDGTHGDQQAGDGIYTANNLTAPLQHLTLNGTVIVVAMNININLANGQQINVNGANLAVVGVGLSPPTKQLAAGIYATPDALFVTDPSWGPLSGFTGFDQSTDANGEAFLQRAASALYSVLPDQFDFIVATPGQDIFIQQDYGTGSPFFYRAFNDINNIGLTVPSGQPTFGSSGRLKGVIYESFGDISLLTHEIGHNWMAFIGQSLAVSGCGTCGGAHWNPNSDIGGTMSAYYLDSRLVDGTGNFSNNGDGTWTLGHDVLDTSGSYSLLDLYLMGLIPSSEVPPINILSNPDVTNLKHVTAGSVTTYSVLQLTGAERVPTYPDGQKHFTMAFVIIKDTPFTPAEFAFHNLIAQFYTSQNAPTPLHFLETDINPFYAATGGRATISAALPVALYTLRTNYFNVVHAASGRPGPVAPGSFVIIKSSFATEILLTLPNHVYYSVFGVSVQLDGINLRIYGLTPNQVEVAIPQTATAGVHTLTVTKNGSVVFTQQVTIIIQNLAAFYWPPDPANPQNVAPQINNATGQLIGSPSSPKHAQAAAGDSLTISCTGGGLTNPILNDDTYSPPPGSYSLTAGAIVTIDETVPATITFAGRAPGSFSMDHIVFTVPSGLASGPHAVWLGPLVYKDALWIK